MKVFILGARGQLGSDVVRVLRPGPYELILINREELDLEKENIAEQLRPYGKPHAVINCMSYHKTDECESFPDKCFRVNVSAVGELAKYCASQDAILFHFTTDYVFGDDPEHQRKWVESDPIGPLSIYGLSKAAGEMIVRAYLPRHFIFRVSSLFGVSGSNGKGGNFVETMIAKAALGQPLKVIADQIMVPTHTLDIARAVSSFLQKNVSDFGTYHCVSGGACSWFEFTSAIFEDCGMHPDLQPTDMQSFKTPARRPKYSALDNTRLSQYHKMPGWRAALREYLRLKGHTKNADDHQFL